MNIPVIFQYLKDLACNNNRDWFNEHKAEYQQAHTEFEALLANVIARISQFDESISTVSPQQCTYRIYRDTRFSPDKTPYKIHFGGYINVFGKKSEHCGYYLHIQPGECMLCGGSYCPPPELLRSLRQAIHDNIDEYKAIVEDPDFKQYFPTVGEKFLKTAPKGFAKDDPNLKYIQCKDFIVCCPLTDESVLAPDFLDRSATIFRQLKRFSDFLNYTIDRFIEDQKVI